MDSTAKNLALTLLIAAGSLLAAHSPTPARASTTVAMAFGAVNVQGGPEKNKFVITEGLEGTPATTPAIPPAAMVGYAPAFEQAQRKLRIVVDPLPIGDPMRSRLLTPLITTLGILFGILFDPDVEEKLDHQYMLMVADGENNPIEAIPPCRQVRFTRLEHHEITGAACPLIREYESVKPPDLNVFAGGGDDTVNLELKHRDSLLQRRVWAGPGDDLVNGSVFDDLLAGDLGNDVITGDKGDDELWGYAESASAAVEPPLGHDRDTLKGDDGNDVILGQWDADYVDGGFDSDLARPAFASYLPEDPVEREIVLEELPTVQSERAALQGGPGRDLVVGGTGEDSMEGGGGPDSILARESDFGFPDEVDRSIDCDANGVLTDPFQYSSRSVWDPMPQNCPYAISTGPGIVIGSTIWDHRKDDRDTFPWVEPSDPSFDF